MSGRHTLFINHPNVFPAKGTLLESKLSTALIETFIDKKVKERLKRRILFALSSFFSQTYRVLLISTSKQFFKRWKRKSL